MQHLRADDHGGVPVRPAVEQPPRRGAQRHVRRQQVAPHPAADRVPGVGLAVLRERPGRAVVLEVVCHVAERAVRVAPCEDPVHRAMARLGQLGQVLVCVDGGGRCRHDCGHCGLPVVVRLAGGLVDHGERIAQRLVTEHGVRLLAADPPVAARLILLDHDDIQPEPLAEVLGEVPLWSTGVAGPMLNASPMAASFSSIARMPAAASLASPVRDGAGDPVGAGQHVKRFLAGRAAGPQAARVRPGPRRAGASSAIRWPRWRTSGGRTRCLAGRTRPDWPSRWAA